MDFQQILEGAEVLIPMHWGDIVGSKADAEAVAKAFTAGKTVIRPLER